jgi:hypothetical protein
MMGFAERLSNELSKMFAGVSLDLLRSQKSATCLIFSAESKIVRTGKYHRAPIRRMGGWQYFGKSWNFPSAVDQSCGVAGMIFLSERRTLTSNIHRNTGRQSYPSAANDIIFLLD